jgi:hypothetical protein
MFADVSNGTFCLQFRVEDEAERNNRDTDIGIRATSEPVRA